jgi:hypothetical protein
MLRTGQLLPLTGFRRWAPTPGVSPRRRQPATGLPGDYPDRTFTGRRTQACGITSSSHEDHLLPVRRRVPSGHAVEGATLDERPVAEDALHAGGECLGAVDHHQ